MRHERLRRNPKEVNSDPILHHSRRHCRLQSARLCPSDMMSRMSQPAEVPDEASEAADRAPAETPLSQPANSEIAIDRFADGLTITVPPAGLWSGTHGL